MLRQEEVSRGLKASALALACLCGCAAAPLTTSGVPRLAPSDAPAAEVLIEPGSAQAQAQATGAPAASAASSAAAKPRAAQPMAWERDEAAARARARSEGRPLLVFLWAAWSASSLWMEREVLSDPRVLAEARGFVALRLDLTAAEGDAELYAERYGASALPAVALFDREGRRVALLLGPKPAEELAAAMRAAGE